MENSPFVTEEALMRKALMFVEKMRVWNRKNGIIAENVPNVEEVFKKLKENVDLDFTKKIP